MNKPTKRLILALVGFSAIVGILLTQNIKDQQRIQKQNKVIHNQDKEIGDLSNQVDELNKTIEDKDFQLEGLNQRISDLQQENSQLRKEKEEKEIEVSRGNSNYVTKTFEVTMYTANEESTGKTPSHPEYGITASGKYVQEGVTIACPPSMDFGTKLYIESIGYRVCQDRGGAITEGHLDVYVEDLQTALEFGRQHLQVRVLKDVNENKE